MLRRIAGFAVMTMSVLTVLVVAISPVQAHAQASAKQDNSARCTFETLSEEDRRRYQSRYRRRVRIDGQAYADAWLQEQACPTEEQIAEQKQVTGKDGKSCTRTRLEMRVTPGFDGAMTMSPVPVCAD